MPGLITHYLCAEACLHQIEDATVQDVLRKYQSLYNVGAQGPDIFFYYVPCLYRRSMRELGNTLHKTKVGAFFSALIAFVDEIEETQHKDAALAYLSGYITHYALDAHAHPYIYYKSGFKTPEGKGSRVRHSVNHRQFETNIDVLMLQLITGHKPSEKKISELVHVKFKEAEIVANLLSNALHNTYGVSLSHKQVFNAFYSMYALNRVLQSPKGRRKRILTFMEGVAIKEHVLSSLVHDDTISDGIDYLNLKKGTWHFPWEKDTAHTHGFTDMFQHATSDASAMILGLFNYMNGGMTREALLALIGNRSLATGMDADLALDFKYHDSVF